MSEHARRKAYPSDVSDNKWAFVAPYLPLMTEATVVCGYFLRGAFNGPALAGAHRLPLALHTP